MKNYSSNRAQKGKTGYRTPSRWLSSRPELFKQNSAHTKLSRKNKSFFKKPF